LRPVRHQDQGARHLPRSGALLAGPFRQAGVRGH